MITRAPTLVLLASLLLAARAHAQDFVPILEQSVDGTILDVDADRILWATDDNSLRIRTRSDRVDTVLGTFATIGYAALTPTGAVWHQHQLKNGTVLPKTLPAGMQKGFSLVWVEAATGKTFHTNIDTDVVTELPVALFRAEAGIFTQLAANGTAVISGALASNPIGFTFHAYEVRNGAATQRCTVDCREAITDGINIATHRQSLLNFDPTFIIVGAGAQEALSNGLASPLPTRPFLHYFVQNGWAAYTSTGGTTLWVRAPDGTRTQIGTLATPGAAIETMSDHGEVMFTDGPARYLGSPGKPAQLVPANTGPWRPVGPKWCVVTADTISCRATTTDLDAGVPEGSPELAPEPTPEPAPEPTPEPTPEPGSDAGPPDQAPPLDAPDAGTDAPVAVDAPADHAQPSDSALDLAPDALADGSGDAVPDAPSDPVARDTPTERADPAAGGSGCDCNIGGHGTTSAPPLLLAVAFAALLRARRRR